MPISSLRLFMRGLLERIRRPVLGRASHQRDPGDPLSRVASLWADHAAETADCPALPGIWTWHPVVRGAMNRRITGREDVQWLAWAKESFFPQPVEHALSLGCGGGHVEREAIGLGLCRNIQGVDLSPGAIGLAKQRAAEAGITNIEYRVADVNQIELPPNTYDLVIVKQSLHHIDNLEHVLDQIASSLRRPGWFLLNEYVGPSRFQWTEHQLAIANQLLALLPERLRRVGGPEGPVRDRVERPSLAEMMAQDPSEAARSAEILPLVEARFEVVSRRDFGGTLLNPMLEGIVPNFAPDSEEEVALLRLLITIEDLLLANHVLPSDFVVLVTGRQVK